MLACRLWVNHPGLKPRACRRDMYSTFYIRDVDKSRPIGNGAPTALVAVAEELHRVRGLLREMLQALHWSMKASGKALRVSWVLNGQDSCDLIARAGAEVKTAT